MGFLDKVKGILGQHSSKAERAVDKGAETLDTKTGGKYGEQIQRGGEKAKDTIRGMGEEKGPQNPT